MGLYKRCEHAKDAKKINGCVHPWWASCKVGETYARVNLNTWAGETIKNKGEAQIVYERMRSAVRVGRFTPNGERAHVAGGNPRVPFSEFADRYKREYIEYEELAGAEDERVDAMVAWFKTTQLGAIDTAMVREYIKFLREPILLPNRKEKQRRSPATINRYIARLRHMFNWAVGEEYIERTPFKRGDKVLISLVAEDNKRHRRLTGDEEDRLMAEASPWLQRAIQLALLTGMRRGELLAVTFADLDVKAGYLAIRGEIAKSGKTRFVPVKGPMLAAIIETQRKDAAGRPKPKSKPIMSNEVGDAIGTFKTAFLAACRRAGIVGLRWHDLRHEFASRLSEKGVPLSVIRDLLGHHSAATTERYDNQKPETLSAAVALLDPAEAELPKRRAGSRITSVSHSADSELETGTQEATR